jgi:spermidine synthase
MGTAWTLIAVAAAYALFALVCLWMARREPAHVGGATLRAGLAATVLSLAAVASGPALTTRTCMVESRYYCIRSLDVTADFGAPTRLMVLDHLGHGINVLDDPGRLVMPYAAIIDTVTRARLGDLPERAYFIGGGSLTLPRAWTAETPRPGIVVAEIDPQVTRVAASDFSVDPTRFTVRHGDARALLRGYSGLQLVIGDAFTDIAVPAHLVTREFYSQVGSALAPEGFYAMNLIDHMDRLQALAATVRTLHEVFDTVEVWVEAEDFTAGGRTTFVLVAGGAPTPQARFVLPPDAPGSSARILGRMPAARIDALVATLDPPVLTDDYVPIDRLMGPKP